MIDKIGDGTKRITTAVYTRHECFECGEPATKRITYLLPNARSNLRSAAYGKDDISWCSDDNEFTCDEHEKKSDGGTMEYCATFTYSERFEHMFHYWRDTLVEYKEPT